MRRYCREKDLLRTPRRTLISSFLGEKLLFTTPLLKWYIEHGLIISKIYQVIEYKPSKCFRKFGQIITKARRNGDINPDSTILSTSCKLVQNSSYGKFLSKISSYQDVFYVEDSSKLINNRRFKSQTPITNKLTEVNLAKDKLYWKVPIQIGFFILQYAKLRMLEFYYDCLMKYISKKNIELIEIDTDSLYLSISRSDIRNIIEDKKGFYETYHTFFPSKACDIHQKDFIKTMIENGDWIMKPCCVNRFNYDNRTPGLFKLEYSGDNMIALGSKDYLCYDTKDSVDSNLKAASKGLSKTLNEISSKRYLNVLKRKHHGSGINRGFCVRGVKVFTYEQSRNGLSYLYIKRKVNEDGITTKPLTI